MSYSTDFTNRFNPALSPNLHVNETLNTLELSVILTKDYSFTRKDNHRYQGVRESQKFNSVANSFIRAGIFFCDQIHRNKELEQSTYNNLVISDTTLGQIVHTKLQLDYLFYQNLTSYNSNWYW